MAMTQYLKNMMKLAPIFTAMYHLYDGRDYSVFGVRMNWVAIAVGAR